MRFHRLVGGSGVLFGGITGKFHSTLSDLSEQLTYFARLLVEIAVAIGVAVEAPRSGSEDELKVGTCRHDGLQRKNQISFNSISQQL